jgi:pyruvate/2-oxoglutarate dehydrogenase complex dihydrolipoamide dehydrogenase (E3) component
MSTCTPHLAARAADYVSVDMKKVIARKNPVSDTASKKIESWLLSMKGCTVIRGPARFVSSHEIEVGRECLTADKIFVNVGGRAVVPAIAGIDKVPAFTNENIMDVDVVPQRLLVLGGSYIGLEFAQAYRRFGSEVTAGTKRFTALRTLCTPTFRTKCLRGWPISIRQFRN